LATGSDTTDGVAVRVVHREEMRGLILCRLSRLPNGAAALPLGKWSLARGRVFHGLLPPGDAGLANSRPGRIQQVYMPPHY
jgi:hypothetical protein